MYDTYLTSIKKIISSGDLSTFKSNDDYRGVLEHVSQQQGHEYLQCIKNENIISLEEIKKFCEKNDSIGSPFRYFYIDIDFYVSPTSLRYIYHACLLLKHVNNLKLQNVDFVEIGCGYGGLYLAIDFLKHKYNVAINSYKMIDLTEAVNLQQLYLSKFNMFSVEFVDASTFGKDITSKNMFLISNYCFSEIDHNFQQKYIELLFPKVSHGFMTWNHIQTYNFGFEFTEIDEVPNTGSMNKYIYF